MPAVAMCRPVPMPDLMPPMAGQVAVMPMSGDVVMPPHP